MSFLSPFWLAAAAAVALPVVLHLLSRGAARRVRVGSVHLLRGDDSARARRLRPTELWLLVLRCLLLVALAAVLAEPRWWRTVEPDPTRGRVLTLDPEAPGGVWSQLREADLEAPPGAPFSVVTAGRLNELEGRRPTLGRAVEWTFADVPTTTPDPPREPRLKVGVTLHHSEERSGDAAYVRAALEAAAEHAGVALEFAAGRPDLAVWLDPEPVPAAILATLDGGGVLVSDGLGRHEEHAAAASFRRREVELHRLSPAEEVPGEAVLWRDGGRPVLAASRHGAGVWYRFHGRFEPRWTSLVLEPAFPEWWLERLDEARGATPAATDQRRVSIAQALPRSVPAGPRRVPSRVPEVVLWALVALLFAGERTLARGWSS